MINSSDYKKKVFQGLNRLVCDSKGSSIRENIHDLYHPQVTWRGFHPFNEMQGIDSIVENFWEPFFHSFPDLERRDLIFIGGCYEGDWFVGAMGHYCSTFIQPWINIPATGKVVYHRYGEFHRLREDRIIESTILIDVLDFIRQVGYWPLPLSLGYEGRWEGPITGDGIQLTETDPEESSCNLQFTLEMHRCLNTYDDSIKNSREDLLHMSQKDYWHPKMMWYGPSGIGTTRNLEGFVDHHQRPFRLAFPNRKSVGHYVQIGDGKYTATSGWPSLQGCHLGEGWLGTLPTGKEIFMRVMDFYLIDDGLLRENWVPIDILHILLQMDIDILKQLDFFVLVNKERS